MGSNEERGLSPKLGSLLKYQRSKCGLTLQGLSNKTKSGISPAYIMRLENCERNSPSIPILIELADALNISVVELLNLAVADYRESSAVESLQHILLKTDYKINDVVLTQKCRETLTELIDTIIAVSLNGETYMSDLQKIVNSVKNFREQISL